MEIVIDQMAAAIRNSPLYDRRTKNSKAVDWVSFINKEKIEGLFIYSTSAFRQILFPSPLFEKLASQIDIDPSTSICTTQIGTFCNKTYTMQPIIIVKKAFPVHYNPVKTTITFKENNTTLEGLQDKKDHSFLTPNTPGTCLKINRPFMPNPYTTCFGPSTLWNHNGTFKQMEDGPGHITFFKSGLVHTLIGEWENNLLHVKMLFLPQNDIHILCKTQWNTSHQMVGLLGPGTIQFMTGPIKKITAETLFPVDQGIGLSGKGTLETSDGKKILGEYHFTFDDNFASHQLFFPQGLNTTIEIYNLIQIKIFLET